MARILPPVPGPGTSQNDYAWLDWYEKVSRAIENTSVVDWNILINTPTTLAGYGITDAQPLDNDLSAIAGLSGTAGLLRKTAVDTWSLDTSTYLTENQTITFTGDVTGSGTTAVTLTLTNSGVVAGTYNNSATAISPFTVDAKGRITSIGAAVTVAPAWSSITSKPTTLAGYGITDAQPLDATLTALAGLNTTAGLVEQTGTDAFTKRAIGTGAGTSIPTYADAQALITTHVGLADPHTQYVQVAGDTLTGVVLNTDGTVSLPSMSFASDPDTGFYRPTTNNIGFTTNGVERVRITTNGMVVGGTTNTITGVGSLALGVKGTTYNTSGGFLTRYENVSDSSYFVLGKSRGATIDALDAVVSADFLGKFICSGTYGTGMGTGGTIYMQAAENWTTTDRGTSFGISLNANGATTGTGRFFINSFGAIGVTSANYGTAGQYLRSSGNAAPPTWSDPLGGASPWVYLKRTSNFTTTSTTYVNVTTLTFTPSANLTYEIEGFFIIDGSVAAAEPSVYISWPTGMTAGAYQLQTINGTSATGPYIIIGGSTDNITPVDSTSDHSAKLHATIVTGAAPSGAVQVQLKSSSANTVTMKTGSWIRYRQI